MADDKRVDDNERWLTDGNCLFCRRDPYCKKPCAAQKRRKAAILSRMVGMATGKDKMEQALKGTGNEGI